MAIERRKKRTYAGRVKRTIGFAGLTWMALTFGCKGQAGRDVESKARAGSTCAQNSDCAEGLVCLADKCADPSAKALYTDPGNAVTPEKVKQHVEAIGEKARRDLDEAVDPAEGK